MTFGSAVRSCLRKYAVFKGRASRSEFWWFAVFLLTLHILLALFDAFVLGTYVSEETTRSVTTPSGVSTSFSLRAHDTSYAPKILFLIFLLPLLSAATRRLHDAGRGGKLLLLVIIPVLLTQIPNPFPPDTDAHALSTWVIIPGTLMFMAGFIMLLFWWVQPSQEGANAYGVAPPAR